MLPWIEGRETLDPLGNPGRICVLLLEQQSRRNTRSATHILYPGTCSKESFGTDSDSDHMQGKDLQSFRHERRDERERGRKAWFLFPSFPILPIVLSGTRDREEEETQISCSLEQRATFVLSLSLLREVLVCISLHAVKESGGFFNSR